MAELNQSGATSGRSRTLKSVPRVDLTAMVDLAFLLITFFMLTTTLSKPFAMKVTMPVESTDTGEVPDDRAMTLCLGANNQILWYMGTTKDPKDVNVTNPSAIRQVFLKQMKKVNEVTGESLILLIKPDDRSKYKNLVDVLDEIAIVKAPTYAIVDITPEDKKIMASMSIY